MSRSGTSRRRVLGLGAALAAAPMLNFGRHRLFAQSEATYSTKAIDLVESSLVVDMLAPLTINNDTQTRWGMSGDGFSAADLEEFSASGIDVFHIAVGLGGGSAQDLYDNTLAFVAAHNATIANRSDAFHRIDSAEDLRRARKDGRIGVLIGTQTSSHFRSPADVDLFYGLGQRVSQLTYNSRNLIGNGATERIDGGISDFGETIVAGMNAVGMAVDVSHCGDQTTLDAFELSNKPVLITHSNCRALAPGHPRCKPDEAIRTMARSGGVMGITGVRMFVKNDEPTTIEHFLDHYDHVRDLIGPEFLGIGSDVDLHGYDDLPEAQSRALRGIYKSSYGFRDKIDIEGIDHPKRVYDLTEGLLRRSYSEADIRGILGGNFERVLGEIWS
ncbi:MAG: membrane dipeptidase [Acidobacteriota bacterium]